MSQKTRALRTIAELALSPAYEDRVYPSLDALTERVGVSRSTVGRAVRTLCQRGAAEWAAGSRELILCSKTRAVDSYKTLWDKDAERVGYTSESHAAELVDSGKAVWGGHRSAVHHLNGYVAASPLGSSVYVLNGTAPSTRSGDVPMYALDADTLPDSGVVSMVQTLAELFNSSDFVSHEFYEELWETYMRSANG